MVFTGKPEGKTRRNKHYVSMHCFLLKWTSVYIAVKSYLVFLMCTDVVIHLLIYEYVFLYSSTMVGFFVIMEKVAMSRHSQRPKVDDI